MKMLMLIAPFLLLLPSGCSLAPKDIGQSYMFALDAAPLQRHSQVAWSLVVARPSAPAQLDTFRISLRRNNTWDYYAGAKWVEFLPAVVQQNLVRSLDSAAMFTAVNADDAGSSGKFILQTQIHSFHAEYAGKTALPIIEIRLTAKLVSFADGSVAASFEGRARQPAAADSLTAIQQAFQAGFITAERRLAEKLQAAVMENPVLRE